MRSDTKWMKTPFIAFIIFDHVFPLLSFLVWKDFALISCLLVSAFRLSLQCSLDCSVFSKHSLRNLRKWQLWKTGER